jgi:hypothetical protein
VRQLTIDCGDIELTSRATPQYPPAPEADAPDAVEEESPNPNKEFRRELRDGLPGCDLPEDDQ